MLGPYRTSALAGATHDDAVPRSTIIGLRLFGSGFVVAAAGSLLAIALVNERCANAAIGLGASVDRAVWVVAALLATVIGARAARGRRVRHASWLAAGASAVGVFVPQARPVAAVVLLGLPLVAAARRSVPRWPLFTVIALVGGRFARGDVSGFAPSAVSVAIFALMAYAFFASARALGEETLDTRAERLSADAPRLFDDARARATFLGPMRLSVDVVVALAIVTLLHSTTLLAYSGSLRLDAPPASVEATGLLVLLIAAIIATKPTTHAPSVAAVVAAGAAVFSAATNESAPGSIALLVVSIALVGLVVVGPRPTMKSAARTTRRFTQAFSAAGVFLGSAGFFALASSGEGEPGLARLAKIGAVVAAITAARTAARLEFHARIELAAEERAP